MQNVYNDTLKLWSNVYYNACDGPDEPLCVTIKNKNKKDKLMMDNLLRQNFKIHLAKYSAMC